MQALIAGIALLVGIVVGVLLRASFAKAALAQLERRIQELGGELSAARTALVQAQSESAARAGFESLAGERERANQQFIAERDGLRRELQAKSDAESFAQKTIAELSTQLENEKKNLAEKLALLDAAKQSLAHQFEALAGKILDEKSKNFSEGSQKELGTLLTPLREQIKEFREKVEEAQKESLVGRTEIASELKQLRSLNENLSSEAHSLSTALRQDTQKQGHWGEQILLLILEKSGFLQKGIHYTYQESFLIEDEETGQNRKQQTDVIVKLPEGRHLIIDCKVTLNAYRDYEKSVNDKERDEALDRLLKSFRDHYKGLADRNYQHITGIQSPDFVVLFAPLEPAFMLAIQKDESLWMDAYKKGVLLAGPTTILFVIRIVENLWRQQQLAKNVEKIKDRGEKLYGKFVGFIDDIEEIGKNLSGATQSYEDARRKLCVSDGNLVRQVEMLRELGLKPKKRLKPELLEAAGSDEVDETLFLLTAEANTEDGEPS